MDFTDLSALPDGMTRIFAQQMPLVPADIPAMGKSALFHRIL